MGIKAKSYHGPVPRFYHVGYSFFPIGQFCQVDYDGDRLLPCVVLKHYDRSLLQEFSAKIGIRVGLLLGLYRSLNENPFIWAPPYFQDSNVNLMTTYFCSAINLIMKIVDRLNIHLCRGKIAYAVFIMIQLLSIMLCIKNYHQFLVKKQEYNCYLAYI